MRYELYLRSDDEPPGDLAERMRSALQADPAVETTGPAAWRHASDPGEVDVSGHPVDDPRWRDGPGERKGKGRLGLDLAIAGGAGEALATKLCELAFDWAERWSVQVYDPQLGRVVEEDDTEAVVARIKQHADYLTDTVGLAEQSTRHMDVEVHRVGLSLRSKFYIGLAVGLLLLGLAAHYCS